MAQGFHLTPARWAFRLRLFPVLDIGKIIPCSSIPAVKVKDEREYVKLGVYFSGDWKSQQQER